MANVDSLMPSDSDVKAIQDWLEKQPHLPQNLDERILQNFIFSCDNSLERAKTCMDMFFTFRTELPEVFCDRDPARPEIQKIFDIIEICPLPDLTPEGYGCLICRLIDPDPDKFNFYDFMKAFFMVGEVRVRKETLDKDRQGLVTGLVPILDMTNLSFRHITKAPVLSMRKYIRFCQEVQPVKLRQIHVVNAIPLFDKMFSIVRPFVKSEIAAAIHLHPPNSTGLYEYVPKDMLPVEYGGSAGTMKDIKESYRQKMLEERDWFLKDEWLADLSKRVGSTDQPEMDGSFRSLAFF